MQTSIEQRRLAGNLDNLGHALGKRLSAWRGAAGLVAVALSLALVATLDFSHTKIWVGRNEAIIYAVPILLAFRLGPPAMVRTVAVLAVIVDVLDVYLDRVPLSVWPLTLGALVAVAILTVRLAAQREEIQRHRAVAESHEAKLAELVHAMAHDLRQPLTVGAMHADYLTTFFDRGDRTGLQKSGQAIAESLHQANTMIGEMVDDARLQIGILLPDQEVLDLRAFLAAFLRRYDPDGHPVGADLPPAPVYVRSDPVSLERIFGNLLANALKYSAADAPVAVALRVDRARAEAVVPVADRGIGIDAEDAPRVFERGFRGREARAMSQGTGLGLHITRRLVEEHGGRIWVESTPGKGSTFYVALPLAEAAEAA
jgi:signal transduction histidine kinase